MITERDRLENMRRAFGGTAERYPHLSVQAISRLFRCWPSEVEAALRHLGIQRDETNAGDVLTAENVKADLDAGLKLQAIARKYDVRPTALETFIPREIPPAPGVEEEVKVSEDEQPQDQVDLLPYRQQRNPRPPVAEVARVRAERKTWTEVAEVLNCSPSTAQRIASENGFTGSPDLAKEWLEANSIEPDAKELAQRESQPTVQGLSEGLQHKARGILPRGLTNRAAEPPLAYLNEDALKGKEARAQVVALAFAMLDHGYYDVQLIVRRVEAPPAPPVEVSVSSEVTA